MKSDRTMTPYEAFVYAEKMREENQKLQKLLEEHNKELILKVFRATSCCFNGEMYEEDNDSEIFNILGPHLDLVEE